MYMADSDRKARAELRRAQAILRKARLQPDEDDINPLSGAAAVSLVHRLTLESWSLSRREMPTYEREQVPVRFVPGRLT